MIPAVPRPFQSRPALAEWRAALAATRFALALTASLMLAACSTAGATPLAATAPPGESAAACPTSQPDPLPAGETRTVKIETDKGAIDVKIEADLSPIAAGNFVALAACGYYDGVVFHRVVPTFVIQGGDGQFGRAPVNPDLVGTGGPGYEIQDETVTATYSRGTVAMARSSLPNSVGSQFFIVLDDSARPALASANTYQIIGTVASGMDAVDAIAVAAGTEENPSSPVVMTRVTVSNP